MVGYPLPSTHTTIKTFVTWYGFISLLIKPTSLTPTGLMFSLLLCLLDEVPSHARMSHLRRAFLVLEKTLVKATHRLAEHRSHRLVVHTYQVP
ncbi:hypothetical protein DSO57_1008146 [Entomophthora muscae]|uniref:Uncharacterized protein n=1 Tax=Entomophthora muscae TaxID=34485 RepID=A0ACC2SK29_9FUNG|nr:hypothetical protein DSO57_1008146 [Entomophthora muscae]